MAKQNCWYCNGSGKYKKPIDEAAYDREFDRLFDVGSVPVDRCREQALKASGYTIVTCPNCSKTE